MRHLLWEMLCLVAVTLIVVVKAEDRSIVFDDNNWNDINSGEWMVKFYGPWCHNCQALASTWNNMAAWSHDMHIKTGEVDITHNPDLSGRFIVRAVPMIIHVKDGVYREYRGPRSLHAMSSYIEEKTYTNTTSFPWYRHPNSIPMATFGLFFRIISLVKDTNTRLTEDFGLSPYVSVVLFALFTVFLGFCLGLTMVYIFDNALDAFMPRLWSNITKFLNNYYDCQVEAVEQTTNPLLEFYEADENVIDDELVESVDRKIVNQMASLRADKGSGSPFNLATGNGHRSNGQGDNTESSPMDMAASPTFLSPSNMRNRRI